MTYHEYVEQRITDPSEYAGPFCPFSIGYCNDAYTGKCYLCAESRRAFENETERQQNRCKQCGETFCRVSVLRHDTSSRPVEVFLGGRFSFCPLCGKKLL